MASRLVRRCSAALVVVMFLASGILPTTPAARAVLAVQAPTGLSPSLTTVNANPVLSWNAVTGAVRYRVQVSTEASFSSLTYNTDTTERYATPTLDLPLGTLYWRVAMIDASNALGPWADTQFTKAWNVAPAPSYPPDGANLTFPTDALRFTWNGLRGASSYELEVDDSSDFVGATTYVTRNTSYVITEPKTSGQTFYWHVRGVSSTSGVVSDWSDTRHATVTWPGVPTLQYPPDHSTIDVGAPGAASVACPNATLAAQIKTCDIYFQWSAVLGAKTYQLQVSPNADFANNKTVDVTVKGTRYAPPISLNNANYYWRVRTLDAANPQNFGTWSDVSEAAFVFQRSWTPRPTLLAPANGSTMPGVPTMTWAPVDHAAYYQVQISEDVNFGSGSSCFTNRTTWTPYVTLGGVGVSPPDGCGIDLFPGHTYYWHVRGIDGPVLNPGAEYQKGILGLWSNTSNADVWSFTYDPAIPAYVSPADGATVQVPTLKWADSVGASKYKVTIYKSGGGVAASGDTYSRSWTPTTALSVADSPFRWAVQAYDANNHLGDLWSWDDRRQFTLEAISTTYATPDPTAPAAGSGSLDMPALAWRPVTGAAKYQVSYMVPGSETYFPLGPQTAYPAYTHTPVLSAGTYEWWVTAYNGSGSTIASSYSARRTFVVSQLDLLAPSDYLTPAKCTTPATCVTVADTATLTWNPVPGALAYTVYVATDPNFTNTYRVYSTAYTRLSPRDSWLDNQANQAYYWFVRPARSGNSGRFDSTAQANASAYRKRSEGVHLKSPADDAIVANQIVFNWENFLYSNQHLGVPVTQEAKRYHIQVSTVSDFATILDDKIVDQTTFTPYDRTYPEGPLYWRVQAIDASENYLTWSSVRNLTKSSPAVSLSYPASGATVTGVPYFQWSPQLYAASYDIEIASSGDTNFSSSHRITLANTKMSAYAYTQPLPAGDYAWHVRRIDADGRATGWTTARVFHLVPAAPALVSPANASVRTLSSLPTLLFQWSSSQPYPKYVLETSTSAGFSSTYESRVTVMTSWAPTTAYAAGKYYWRVKAMNAAGTIVATSSAWSLTIGSPPGAPRNVNAISRNASAIVRWTAPSSPGSSAITGYTVTASPGGRTCTGGATSTSCTVTGLTNGTWYTFTVKAGNVVGTGAGATTVAVLPLPSEVRASGANVYATAAAVSRDTFRANCGCVAYIASATAWPDALGGAAAAGTVKGPMLFVGKTLPINSATTTELTRLKPTKIIVLGGTAVVPDAVKNALASYAPSIVRYSGADRFKTAADVSSHSFAANCGCTAYIAYAYNYPDALGGAAAAGKVKGPVLLVNSTGSLNAATTAELTRLKPSRIVVLGGTSVVSGSVYTALSHYAPSITRYSGANRYATAADVSSHTFPSPSTGCGCIAYVAAGTDPQGALAGAAAAGTLNGPLLLVSSTSLPSATSAELTRLKPYRIVVLGDTSKVSATVYSQLAAYATGS